MRRHALAAVLLTIAGLCPTGSVRAQQESAAPPGPELSFVGEQVAGLVQQVVAHEDLLSAADIWCTRIVALPPHAVSMTKPLLRAAADASWDHAIAMEEFAEPQCFTTHAFQDSVKALLSPDGR